jgi:hypothetical protein
MDAPQAQAPAAAAQVAVIDKEKIPLFHADAKQDSFQAEYWIQRLGRLQTAQNWTDSQTVCNAVNSLRGEALHFVDYLDVTYGENTSRTNWLLFKEKFLLAFGKRAKDTSSVANLAIMQKDKETVQKFAHRVVVTTKEFFQAMNAPEEPNFLAAPQEFQPIINNELARRMATYYIKEEAATYRSYLNKTIFLNGLRKEINAQVKNTNPVTWIDAVENATTIDRNMQGPIDHTIALEKSTPATSVNFIRRGSSNRGRGRGGSSGSSRFQPSSGGFQGKSSAAARANVECWYCRKPGHPQKFCRKRIARGADTVPKPRSVAEITTDNIDYQDDSEAEDNADDNDQDEYLNDALDEEINSINVSAVHLN